MNPNVIILMGSKADLPHAQKIVDASVALGLEPVIRIGSAHKTPVHVLDLLEGYEADPAPKVYITVAGRSNALSGFVDGSVRAPVIACPPPSEPFGGADIYSSLRLPSGIAPGLVLDPANAALLAAKIIGLGDPVVQAKVAAFQAAQAERILQDDAGEVNNGQ
jgi:phosphoribosylaminoimidazole carboxylase PurE protein